MFLSSQCGDSQTLAKILSSQQKQDALVLSKTLSTSMAEWCHWVIDSHAMDAARLQACMADL